MHILFLTNEYPKKGFPHGGVGTFVSSLSKLLVKKNINVSILGLNYNSEYEEEIDEEVKVYRLPNRKLIGLSWYYNFRQINFKILEINDFQKIGIIEGSEFSFSFIKKIRGIKYLIRMHGGHHFFAESENRKINWWKGFQEKCSFKKADAILGVSNYVMNHTSHFIHFDSRKTDVIFNPIDLTKFYQSNLRKIIKGRIFFAGTVCEKKGIRQLIQAMPYIKKVFPETHLVIAGRDWKFPSSQKSYTEYLTNFIDPSVQNSIKFLGPVPNCDIPTLIEESEICCYPSHMEAMPLSWIEVLAMGKAFIGGNAGPASEIVLDNFTGILCDPKNPIDIANKIIYLLANNDKAIELGFNARKDIFNRFDINKLIVKNINFYKSLI